MRGAPTVELEQVPCSLCGADNWELHLTRGDLNLFLGGNFRLVRCRACGLVYLNPRPPVERLGGLYRDDYDQYTVAVPAEPSWLARLDREYGLRKRCRVVLRRVARGRLLDVGCATGDFLWAMRRCPGWEVAGVELNPAAAHYARNRLQLDVRTGTLEAAGFEAGAFDVVTMWDVLEHLPDPAATLRLAAQLLRPGGLLVINTPNLDSFDARVFGKYWIGYELPRHLSVFSRRTLEALTAQAGFRTVDFRNLYGSHAWAMSSLRFWLRAHMKNDRLRARLEAVILSRPVRVLCLPYFLVMDQLRLSSGMTVSCLKVS